MLTAVLMLAALQIPSPAIRDTLRMVERAFESGGSAAVRAPWEQAARRAPAAPMPALALALLDRLRYDYAAADRRATAVLRSATADRAARLHAQLLLAGNVRLRRPIPEVAALYAEARSTAMLEQDAVAAAEATVALAVLRNRMSGVPAALATLDTAEALAGTDAMVGAAAACSRAALLGRVGDSTALRHVEAGRRLAKRAGSGRVDAACLFAGGQYWMQRPANGGISRALKLFGEAEAVQSRVGDLVGRSAARQWAGALLLQTGNYPQARTMLQRAVDDAARSGNTSVRGWAGLNLASLAYTVGDDAAAFRHLADAEAIATSSGDRWLRASVLNTRIDMSLDRGQLVQAASEIQESLALAQANGDARGADGLLPARVRLARRMSQHDSVLHLLDRADSLAARRGTPGFIPSLARAAYMLDLDRLDDAEAALRRMPPVLSSQASYVRRARLAEVAAKRGDLATAEQYLTMALDSLDHFRSILRQRDLRLQVQQFRSLDQLDPDLGIATVLGRLAMGNATAASFALAGRLRSHEMRVVMLRRRALDTTDVDLPVLSPREDHAVTAVQAALRPGEALVLSTGGRGREPTTAWIVGPESVAAVQLPMADSLAPLVRRFGDLLASRQNADGLARRLGGTVLAPIVAALPPGTSRLLLAPDGPLLSLPFDALILPDGRMAIDRYTISFVPSPAVFVALRRLTVAPRAGRGVLALAQPLRGEHGSWRQLPALPWSAREAQGIVRTVPGSSAVVGPMVRVAAVRSAASDQFAVLHLAAHAVIDEQVPARSAILLEPARGAVGELRLSEVEALHLPMPLVVLSSCRTVRGRTVHGEGLRSLSAAFLQAGARSIVGTAWDVEDARMAAFMTPFYAALAQGQDVGTALVSVKREFRRRGRPVSEWAVLQLLGDPGIVPLGHEAP